MRIDLCIRVYPGVSKSPVLSGSKLQTFSRCFKSLCASLHASDFDTSVEVLLDNCGLEFEDLILKIAFQYSIDIKISNVEFKSNALTFKYQLDRLSSSKADLIAFVEDDYLFDEDCFANLFKAAEQDRFASFYTLFNSSDYETLWVHKHRPSSIMLGNTAWKEVNSTTLTFFCSPKLLARHAPVFETFLEANNDFIIWLMITGKWRRVVFLLILWPNITNIVRLAKLIKFRAWKQKEYARLLCSSKGKMLHLEAEGFSSDHLDAFNRPKAL